MKGSVSGLDRVEVDRKWQWRLSLSLVVCFDLCVSQPPFIHTPQDGVLLGAVGAYDWNGAILKDTKHGKVVPPKSSYKNEFPEELKNHAAYLGRVSVFSNPTSRI